jgi:hypothetical protein
MRKIPFGYTVLILLMHFSFIHPGYLQSSEEGVQARQGEPKPEAFKPEQQAAKGTVTFGGNVIPYDAYSGTLVVHPKGWDGTTCQVQIVRYGAFSFSVKQTRQQSRRLIRRLITLIFADRASRPAIIVVIRRELPRTSSPW